MDIKAIKKDMCERPEKLEKLLEYFEFHSFSYHGNNIRCAVPGGDNITSVSIYLSDGLFGTVYTRGGYKGDVFHIINHVTGRTLKDIFNITRTILGYGNGTYKTVVSQANNIIEDIRKFRKKKKVDVENKKYNLSVMNRYIALPHEELIKEGISPKVANEFGISYDSERNRILFPHYDWEDKNKIVGIQGRIVGMTTEECNLLGVPKYWNYITGYKKTHNMYGWHQARQGVVENRKLIIFESEKSVLKQFTFEKGKGYSVAISGHEVSKHHIAFIANNTPIDCEIILAFDKDVMVKEYDKLLKTARQISRIRKTSFIYDNIKDNKLLREKDAPVDRGLKIWRYLESSRIVV